MGWTKREICFVWKKSWRPILTILFPLIFSLILLWGGTTFEDEKNSKLYKGLEWRQPRAAMIVFIMAAYWLSECLPLPVTALTPVFLFPLCDVLDTETVTKCYLDKTVLLLAAGCIMALAIEYSNLHSRIALGVIKIVGTKIPWLLLGVTLTAMFLSMWLNNTSTTAMMVPIVFVVMDEFENAAKDDDDSEETPEPDSANPPAETASAPVDQPKTEIAAVAAAENKSQPSMSVKSQAGKTKRLSDATKEKVKQENRNIKIMFLLAIAWGSNIGGTGTIIGSGTNLIAQSQLSLEKFEGVKNKEECKQLASEMDFVGWLKFNIVPMLLATILTWVILLLWFMGLPRKLRFWQSRNHEAEAKEDMIKHKTEQNIKKAIGLKYTQLGRVTLHEILVIIIFIAMASLWVTGGQWHLEFNHALEVKNKTWYSKKLAKAPHSATHALFLCMLMFVIPKDAKYYKDFMNGGLAAGLKDTVLQWRLVETQVPWGPLILIGGGSALGKGIKESGLGSAIGVFLKTNKVLQSFPPAAYLVTILVIVACLTTVASNTATAAIFTPVLIAITKSKGTHPLYLVETATVSASYAFILPISTPPNAIVFEKSDMTQKDMALPGIVVTIATNALLFAMVHSYNELIFGFNEQSSKLQYCLEVKK